MIKQRAASRLLLCNNYGVATDASAATFERNMWRMHVKRFVGWWLAWFGFGWTCLESSSAFGLVDTHRFGGLGYGYLVLLAFAAAAISTYLRLYPSLGETSRDQVQPTTSERFPGLIAFHESYRSTDWAKLIGDGHKIITVCGFYFDSWFGWSEASLKSFLRSEGTLLRIIVSKATDKARLAEIARLFPQYSQDLVASKIVNTQARAYKLLDDIHMAHSKVEVYEYPEFLNYSYILVDDASFYLTIYEMERTEKRDSLAFVIDLNRHPSIKAFIEKENRLILKHSTLLPAG